VISGDGSREFTPIVSPRGREFVQESLLAGAGAGPALHPLGPTHCESVWAEDVANMRQQVAMHAYIHTHARTHSYTNIHASVNA
jgi:hypothetical protein